jgi:hypothetical protein
MGAEPLPAVFWETHEDNPREGPGRRGSILRALRLALSLPSWPRVVDIGSGPVDARGVHKKDQGADDKLGLLAANGTIFMGRI